MNQFGSLNSVGRSQADVHQNHIWPETFHLFNDMGAVGKLSHDFQFTVPSQLCAEEIPPRLEVFHHEDSNGCFHRTSRSIRGNVDRVITLSVMAGRIAANCAARQAEILSPKA